MLIQTSQEFSATAIVGIAGSMLVHRLRRWHNNDPAMSEGLVFAGIFPCWDVGLYADLNRGPD